MINKTVKNTIYFSLFIQIITTLYSLKGLFLMTDKRDEVLKEILVLEAGVQFIEAFFYIWVILALNDLEKMTPRRYFDWCITTPIMLFTTIVFMEYQYNLVTKPNERMTIKKFFKENKENILKITFYNAMMLLFGILGEMEILNKQISVGIGFIFFYLSFKTIYDEYAKRTEYGIKLFKFLTFFWSLYGIAALAEIKVKNISYNFLDIFAKNFYGLYIYYYITMISY
tara:strand:+ start:461 stop:1141 length:681 start_codon:yes stop_codon:yes gene_type:complete